MIIKEIKQINTAKLRSICITNNWYTKGTCEEYENMFNMCKVDTITPEILYAITKDIYDHTNVKAAVNGCSEEYSDIDNILNMMIYVHDATETYYNIVEINKEKVNMKTFTITVEVYDNTSIEQMERIIGDALNYDNVDCTYNIEENTDYERE